MLYTLEKNLILKLGELPRVF